MKRIFQLLLLVCCCLLPTTFIQAAPTVQFVDNMTRIGRNQAVNGSSTLTLYAAKNETESFQVVVSADNSPLTITDITISPFSGAANNITTTRYREHYVTVTTATPLSQYAPQDYPDALVPFTHPDTGANLAGNTYDAVPFTISANQNQPFWVDVAIPANTPAGNYSATVTVAATDGQQLTLPLNLVVWNFELPKVPAMRSAFGLVGGRIAEIYDVSLWGDQEYINPIIRRYTEMLTGHLLAPDFIHGAAPDIELTTADVNFDGLPYPNLGTAAETLDFYADDVGLSTLSISFFPNYPYDDPLSPPDDVLAATYVGNFVDYLESQGWADRAYIHANFVDEPHTAAMYQSVRDWGAFFNAAETLTGETIPMMVTEQPTPENPAWGSLVGYVDIWVPLFDAIWADEEFYDTDNISARIAAGDEVWSYTALSYQSSEWGNLNGWPSQLVENHDPKWQTDFAPINYRIPAWLNPLYDITGLLYWTSIYWEPSVDVWNDAGNYFHTDQNQTIHNGEGLLMYPAFADEVGFDGAVPSMRLKWLRESVEDYGYIELLREQGDWTFAKQQINTFATHFSDWDDDTDALAAARKAMGNRLSSPPTSIGLQSTTIAPSTNLSLLLLAFSVTMFVSVAILLKKNARISVCPNQP